MRMCMLFVLMNMCLLHLIKITYLTDAPAFDCGVEYGCSVTGCLSVNVYIYVCIAFRTVRRQ